MLGVGKKMTKPGTGAARARIFASLFVGLSLVVALALACAYALAQGRDDGAANRTQATDLSMRNLDRVAASAAEIRPILIKEPGLMVELRRWIAREASNHGQIVNDTDLASY